MKKFILLLLVVLSAFYLFGCDIKQPPIETPVNIEILITGEDSIEVNATTELMATISDKTYKITWESSNPEIATVDENGKVLGISKGEAIITAKVDDNNYDVFSITVTEAVEEQLTLTTIREYIESCIPEIINDDLQIDYNKFGDNVTFTLESTNKYCISNEGEYLYPYFTNSVILKFNITFMGSTFFYSKLTTVQGQYTIDEVKETIESKIPNTIDSDFSFKSNEPYTNSPIIYTSSNEAILGSDGKYNSKTSIDKEITITYLTYIQDKKVEGSKTVRVIGNPLYDIMQITIDSLNLKFSNIGLLIEDIELPLTDETNSVVIEWTSDNQNVIDNTGKVNTYIINQTANLTAKITFDNEVRNMVYELKTPDLWNCIENVLDRIHQDEIKQTLFKTFDGPNNVRYTADNNGFLQFYYKDLDSSSLILSESKGTILKYAQKNYNSNVEKVNIKPGIVNEASVNRPVIKKVGGSTYKANHWIVIHDTGDIVFTAAQWNHQINTDSRQVSWHFTVDDKDIYQHIPLDEVAYHAGDGSRTPADSFSTGWNHYAGGNRNGIGIETSVHRGVDYNQVMRNTANLVAKLMIEFDLGMDNIRTHQDMSGKMCPQSMIRLNTYKDFLKMVETEYIIALNLQGVKMEFTSLNPTILSNEGKVLTSVTTDTTVKYNVKVTVGDEVKTYEFTTIIHPRNA